MFLMHACTDVVLTAIYCGNQHILGIVHTAAQASITALLETGLWRRTVRHECSAMRAACVS